MDFVRILPYLPFGILAIILIAYIINQIRYTNAVKDGDEESVKMYRRINRILIFLGILMFILHFLRII